MRNPIARRLFEDAVTAHRSALAGGFQARTGDLHMRVYKALSQRHRWERIQCHLPEIVGIVDGIDAMARECAAMEAD